MRAGEQNFIIEQGVDWRRQLTFYNQNGDRVDLIGDSFAMQIKQTAQTPNILSAPVITILEPPIQGQILIELSASQASALSATGSNWSKCAEYTYDLIRIRSDGRRARILNGTIRISPEVTKI